VNAKKGEPLLCKRIHVTFAGHPLPDEDSVASAGRIVEIMQKAKKGDIVFYVLSGGHQH
jgi:glycerate-2-kinase